MKGPLYGDFPESFPEIKAPQVWSYQLCYSLRSDWIYSKHSKKDSYYLWAVKRRSRKINMWSWFFFYVALDFTQSLWNGWYFFIHLKRVLTWIQDLKNKMTFSSPAVNIFYILSATRGHSIKRITKNLKMIGVILLTTIKKKKKMWF